MIIVLMFLVLCVLLESLVIKELLEQKRQIALQLKLLEEAYTWRMNSRDEVNGGKYCDIQKDLWEK